MSKPRLPDGSDAWFVRVRKRNGISVQPCSREGWTATIAFVFVTLVLSLALTFFVLSDSLAMMIGVGTLFAAAVIGFLILVARTSAKL